MKEANSLIQSAAAHLSYLHQQGQIRVITLSRLLAAVIRL